MLGKGICMTKIDVYCSSEHHVYEDTYGEEGDYTGFRHDGHENHQVYFHGQEYACFEASFVTELEEPYLVYILYSTGGSFGKTDGYFRAIGVYSKEEAERVKKLIETCKEPYGWNKDKEAFEIYEKAKKELDKLNIYDVWNGYFESLEEVSIKKVF